MLKLLETSTLAVEAEVSHKVKHLSLSTAALSEG